MSVFRTFDEELLHTIVRDPSVYPTISDDLAPPKPEDFSFNYDDFRKHIFILWRDGVYNAGFWLLKNYNPYTYEIHTCILENHRGLKAYTSSAEMLKLAFTRLGVRTLTTRVPDFNSSAKSFARGCGMNPTFVEPQSFLKDGKRNDQQHYCMTFTDWFFSCDDPTFVELGNSCTEILSSVLNIPHRDQYSKLWGIILKDYPISYSEKTHRDSASYIYNSIAPLTTEKSPKLEFLSHNVIRLPHVAVLKINNDKTIEILEVSKCQQQQQ